jgi:ABC-type amino acid transport substrate-binding protein
MKKYGFMLVLFVLTACLLVACGAKKETNTAVSGSGEAVKKVLTMGTSADFPPFEYVDTAKGSEVIGFDVDLAKALANKAGYDIKVQDMDFNGLITAMQAGKVDFVMSGMEATEERKKNADFTGTYFRSDLVMLIKADSGIKTIDDFKGGKSVGVQVGSIQQGKAEELQKTIDFKISNRDRVADLVQELKAGRMDGVLLEQVVAKGYLNTVKGLTTTAIPNGETTGASIAFPKDSTMTAEFNKALEEIKKNGELDKLIAKWFGDH